MIEGRALYSSNRDDILGVGGEDHTILNGIIKCNEPTFTKTKRLI